MRLQTRLWPAWGDLIWWGVFGWVVGCLVAGLFSCAPASLSPAQVADVTDTAARTEKCKAEGRKHNSYHSYDCCMILAGLHPGAACQDAGALPPAVLHDENPYLDGGPDGSQR